MFGFKHGKSNGQADGVPGVTAGTPSVPAPAAAVTDQEVLAALSRIQDPDLRKDIVTLGFVKDLSIQDSKVSFKIELTTPACPVKGEMERMAREYVAALPGVSQVDVSMTSSVRSVAPAAPLLPGVRNVIAIASGKGGVGKSTVAVNLAVALARTGARVGLLDADVYGPTIPGLLGASGAPQVTTLANGQEALVPIQAHGLKIMSMAFFLPNDPSQPLIWRGPMVHSGIRQMIGQTDWGELDYLLVDMPPGTGDATLTLAQSLTLSGVVIVTQPQDVSLAIAIKALRAFQSLKVKILGIVENMSYFVCDNCDKRHDIFSHGGGRRAAEELEVPFLGEVPLSLDVRESSDTGAPVVALKPDSPQAIAFSEVAKALAAQVSILGYKQRKTIPLRAV